MQTAEETLYTDEQSYVPGLVPKLQAIEPSLSGGKATPTVTVALAGNYVVNSKVGHQQPVHDHEGGRHRDERLHHRRLLRLPDQRQLVAGAVTRACSSARPHPVAAWSATNSISPAFSSWRTW